ncbi:MAG: ABC transporter transmembrane domain-containing protein [Pirellulales bacterium]
MISPARPLEDLVEDAAESTAAPLRNNRLTSAAPQDISTADLPAVVQLLADEPRGFVAARLTRRTFKSGETLAQVGEPCRAVWFVARGLVDVQFASAMVHALGMPGPILRAGDSYGSHAFDSQATHSVTLTALCDAEVWELSGDDLRTACAAHDGCRQWYESVLNRRMIASVLVRLANLHPASIAPLARLANRLEAVEVAAGQVIQRSGEPIEVLQIVESGALVAMPTAGAQIMGRGATELGPGSVVSATSYCLRAAAAVDVTAAMDSRLYVLPSDAASAEDLASVRAALSQLIALGLDVQPTGSAGAEIDRSCVAYQGTADEDDLLGEATQPAWWQRLPQRRQREEMDCGAACLRMLHSFYGHEIGEREARQLARVSRYGTSLADLSEAAERLGYLPVGVEVPDAEALSSVQLPAIAHVDKNHFVVVWRVSSRHVEVGDPAIGRTRLPRAEFVERFGGFLLLVRPTDATGKTPAAKEAAEQAVPTTSLWRKLWPFARPHLGTFGYVLLASALLQLFGLAGPMLTQVIIDRVIGHGETRLLPIAFGALLLTTVFGAIVGYARSQLMLHASLAMQRTLMEAVYQRMLSLAHSFFSRFTTGDLVRRFGEVDEVRRFFTNHAISSLVDVLMVTTYAIVLVWMQPALAGVFIGVLLVSTVISILIARPVRSHTKLHVQKFARVNTHVIDSFKGIDPVKAMSVERPFRRWFGDLLRPSIEFGRRAALWSLASGTIIQLLDGINSGVVLWRGTTLVLAGAMTLGQLMAFLMLSRQLSAPVLRLLEQWDEFQRTVVSLERVGDLLEETSERDHLESRGAMLKLPNPRGAIRLENLSFAYSRDSKDSSRRVIDTMNLEIKPGEVVGVVGRSGCGKSTLARLLLRFEEPTAGRILLDGIHLRDLDPEALRQQIGLVTQDAVLYSGTIRDNILCGRQDVSEEDMVRAAQAAGAYDFISELPYGFETRIGDQGMKLSGGQSQRVVIARALCADPRILIFDEATAALDPLLERDIHEGLREVIKGRTTLIIAHRLHTLRRADRIVVMDRGRLVEQGTHEELMACQGLYYQMYTASPDWQGNA